MTAIIRIANALRLSLAASFRPALFTLLSIYTYSRCMQDAVTLPNKISGNQYQNPYNRNADYSRCDFDLPNNLVNSFVYERCPKFTNRAVNTLAGNWQFSFTPLLSSPGFPFTPLTGVDASLTGVGLDRPNVVGDPYVRNTSTLAWINSDVICCQYRRQVWQCRLQFASRAGVLRLGHESDPAVQDPRKTARRATVRVLQHFEPYELRCSRQRSEVGDVRVVAERWGSPAACQFAAKYSF